MTFVPESHFFSEENNPIYAEPNAANVDNKKKKREPPSEASVALRSSDACTHTCDLEGLSLRLDHA